MPSLKKLDNIACPSLSQWYTQTKTAYNIDKINSTIIEDFDALAGNNFVFSTLTCLSLTML